MTAAEGVTYRDIAIRFTGDAGDATAIGIINGNRSISAGTEVRVPLALLRDEQAVFEESLADADDWLRNYFDTNSAQVRGARATIEEIRGSMVVVSPPDISGSLQLLRRFNSISGTAQ